MSLVSSALLPPSASVGSRSSAAAVSYNPALALPPINPAPEAPDPVPPEVSYIPSIATAAAMHAALPDAVTRAISALAPAAPDAAPARPKVAAAAAI